MNKENERHNKQYPIVADENHILPQCRHIPQKPSSRTTQNSSVRTLGEIRNNCPPVFPQAVEATQSRSSTQECFQNLFPSYPTGLLRKTANSSPTMQFQQKSQGIQNVIQEVEIPYVQHQMLIDKLSLSKKSHRMKTFSEFPFLKKTRKLLTKAGFFYLGNLDRIQCYFCKHVFEYWLHSEEDIQLRHRELSSQCGTMRGSPTNIPIYLQEKEALPPKQQNIPESPSFDRNSEADFENLFSNLTKTPSSANSNRSAPTSSSGKRKTPMSYQSAEGLKRTRSCLFSEDDSFQGTSPDSSNSSAGGNFFYFGDGPINVHIHNHNHYYSNEPSTRESGPGDNNE